MQTRYGPILLLVFAGACANLGAPNGAQYNYADIEIDGSAAPGGQVTAQPQALFFRSVQLVFPDSHSPRDVCVVQSIPGSTGTIGSVASRPIAGGDSVAVRLDSVTTYLTPQSSGNQAVYGVPGAGRVTYAPGALLRVTTLGATAGFPAATDTVTTAEPFTMDSLPSTATPGRTIVLHWTPAPHPGSKLFVELRYAATGTTPTDEIVCDLSDTGTFTIPSLNTVGYFSATAPSRQHLVTRMRTTLRDLGGGNVLYLLSTYSVTVPTASAAVAQR